MKYYIFQLALLLSLQLCMAQSGYEAKLSLKNGVKIKGGIVESFNEEYLKLKVTNRADPILIRYDHIRKIQFTGGHFEEGDEIEYKVQGRAGIQTKTFYHELRGGLLFGEENVSGSIHTLNGYQFSQHLGTGVGLGLNKFGNYISLPVYATVKGYLKNDKVCPFYFGDVGYGFTWRNNNDVDGYLVENVEGGLYWQLGVGYQLNYPKSAFVCTLGYLQQRSKADYIYQYWALDGVEVSEKRTIRRVSLSVGILF